MVMVDEIPFPPQITTTKPLILVGSGITDIVIHFLQIKHNAIGIYLDENIVEHLENWKGKKGSELVEDDDFFDALISAPTEKYFRVVIIKEIKGAQFGLQVETAVRDRLVSYDKYEEEEEEEVEKIVHFFQTPYLKKGSVITYHFPANSHTAEFYHDERGTIYYIELTEVFESDPDYIPNLTNVNNLSLISYVVEGKDEVKIEVENANVAEMIQKWYLGGSKAVSQGTVQSLGAKLGEMLSVA